MDQRFNEVTEEYNSAVESKDKNKQFMATIKVIALVIEYIMRAINGTLGDKLDKDEGKAGKEGGQKPPEGAKEPVPGSPEAAAKAAKTEVENKVNNGPATPERTQQAAAEVKAEAGKNIEANNARMKEIPAELKKEGDETAAMKKERGDLDAQRDKLKTTVGAKPEDIKKLDDQIKHLDEKIAVNDKRIAELKKEYTDLEAQNKNLEAKEKAADQIGKGMDKLKAWMPVVEKMIGETLGLKIGAGGIAIGPEGQLKIDLLTPAERAKAMEKLGGAGATKEGDKSVVMTQEQIAKAIVAQLPGGAEQKPAGAADAKKPAEAKGVGTESSPETPEIREWAKTFAKFLGDYSPENVAKILKDPVGNHDLRGDMSELNKAFALLPKEVKDRVSDLNGPLLKELNGNLKPLNQQVARAGDHLEIHNINEPAAKSAEAAPAGKPAEIKGEKPAEPKKEAAEAKEQTEKLNETVKQLNVLFKEAFVTGMNPKAKEASPLTRLAGKTEFVVKDGKIAMKVDASAKNEMRTISKNIGYTERADGSFTREGQTVEKNKDGDYQLGLEEAFGTKDIKVIESRLQSFKTLMADPDKMPAEERKKVAEKFDGDKDKVAHIGQSIDFKGGASPALEAFQKDLPREMRSTNVGRVIGNMEYGSVNGNAQLKINSADASAFHQAFDQIKMLTGISIPAAVKDDKGNYYIDVSGDGGKKVLAGMKENVQWMKERFCEEKTEDKPAAVEGLPKPEQAKPNANLSPEEPLPASRVVLKGGKAAEKSASAKETAKEDPIAKFNDLAKEVSSVVSALPETAWDPNAYPDINSHPSVQRILNEMNSLASNPETMTKLESAIQSTDGIKGNGKEYTLTRSDERGGYGLEEKKPPVTAKTEVPQTEDTEVGGAA